MRPAWLLMSLQGHSAHVCGRHHFMDICGSYCDYANCGEKAFVDMC